MMLKLDSSDLRLLRHSPFFDARWYLEHYPDVAQERWDPIEHYLWIGASEGRDPSPFFGTRDYMARWPETADGTVNPLVHFLRFVSGEQQVEQDRALVLQSGLFQPAWYIASYPDVAMEGIDPAYHYLLHGAWEGRDPGPDFSSALYFQRRSDLTEGTVNPLVHFLRFGITEMSDEEAMDFKSLEIAPPAEPVVLPSPPQSYKRKLGRKAVFVTHDFNIGGAPKLLLSIASWFQRCTDYDVHVVAMATGPFHADFLRVAPVHIVGHLTIADGDVPILRDALRDFLGEEPAFTFINSAASGHYCKIDPFKAPVFGYIHELTKILEMFGDHFATLMAHAQHVFCGAPLVRDAVLAAFPDREAMLTTRPSFIIKPDPSTPSSAAEKIEARRAMGWVADRKIVMACGIAHWRKQPFVFVRLAAKLVRELGRDVDFVWVGGGEDLAAMREMSVELGISDRLHLLGHQDDLPPLFQAADVFALTSSEDPFPLVCLEAGARSVPLVVFREATGVSDIIEQPGKPSGGAAVPLGDEEAFFAAVDALITDDAHRNQCGEVIRGRVMADYIDDAACMELLRKIRTIAELRPRVSVVLPSYNSAVYLEPRLKSIAEQTFRDIEVLLLDDASSDESPAMLTAFAAEHPEARVLLAEQNGGSVFKAWERGIHAATGDYIWLAEADDWCEPTFLDHALAAFEPSGVRLVHARSIPTDSAGEIAGDWNDLYLDHIVPGLWRKSFWSPSAKEIDRSLGRANTIVNASGVLVQRPAAVEAIKLGRHFKLAGDWAFYVAAAHGGRIAYCHEAVNYHRRHTTSVTASVEGSDNYFQELMNVGAIVRALYGENEVRDAAFRRHIEGETRRFSYPKPLPEGSLPDDFTPRRPGVMFGVGDLSGGGAQMFAVRFVNKWNALCAPAALFVAGYGENHPATRRKVDPMVPILTQDDIAAEGGLSGVLKSYGLDLIASGHWWADQTIGYWQEREQTPVPWVIVMHGCYESVLESPEAFAGFEGTLERAERFCAHWVWTAPKNKRLFEEGRVLPRAVSHIVNGFEPVKPSGMDRAQLGLPEDALVFTLASRALVEKGWRVTLEAFGVVREAVRDRRDVRLQLIGDGPVAAELRHMGAIDGVHAVPHTGRLADYIAASDICVLPSWFVGESLPLVLIEFLAQHKPAIVSDIGMCPWAIGEESTAGPAGLVVPRGADGSVGLEPLAAAMRRLVEDPDLLDVLASRTPAAFAKFDLDDMADHYDRVFADVLGAGDRRAAEELSQGMAMSPGLPA